LDRKSPLSNQKKTSSKSEILLRRPEKLPQERIVENKKRPQERIRSF